MKRVAVFLLTVVPVTCILCGCDEKETADILITKAPIEVSVSIWDKTDKDIDAGKEDQVSDGYYDPSGDENAADAPGSDEDDKAGEETDDEDAGGEDTGGEDTDGEDTDGETEDEDKETENTPVTPGAVENVGLSADWQFAANSAINSGSAKLYRAAGARKGVVIGINAGHGTKGGQSVKTLCHPDGSPKVTGGSTASGSIKATAVSGGMSFLDGTSEASVTLREAQILRDILLSRGYDVLMLRDDSDVQLDNVARTVIANNNAACHIAIHWDGDNLSYDKGCFYISTPDGIKGMDPVSSHWQQHEALGRALISGLSGKGCKIYKGGSMSIDLTQTSYSTIPSVDIELGNAASAHDDATLTTLAQGLADGISSMF